MTWRYVGIAVCMRAVDVHMHVRVAFICGVVMWRCEGGGLSFLFGEWSEVVERRFRSGRC
jgi:hypothetical protein